MNEEVALMAARTFRDTSHESRSKLIIHQTTSCDSRNLNTSRLAWNGHNISQQYVASF